MLLHRRLDLLSAPGNPQLGLPGCSEVTHARFANPQLWRPRAQTRGHEKRRWPSPTRVESASNARSPTSTSRVRSVPWAVASKPLLPVPCALFLPFSFSTQYSDRFGMPSPSSKPRRYIVRPAPACCSCTEQRPTRTMEKQLSHRYLRMPLALGHRDLE